MSEQRHAPLTGSTMEPWLLVEEITHRVANEYAAAVGSISLASARCADRDAKTALAGAARRLLDYADAHRALQPPPVAERPADLGRYLRGLCEAITRSSLAERRIALTLFEETIALDAGQCWRVGMIVFELITNAARHGLRDREGSIVVELAAQGDVVQCRVADDGTCGHPTPGRGTRITRALALELGGHIDWHFGVRGTTATLCFPRSRH